MNTQNFYKNISSFSEFHDVLNPDYYHPVPDDWLVLISDIKGSTQAINEGKYKAVNVVGASCIISVINAVGGNSDIPFVFGGDGASFVIPPSLKDKVGEALIGTRKMAKDSFNMDLRVGLVPVQEILKGGKKINIAKYDISENMPIAMFSGGGLAYADTYIKQHEAETNIDNFIDDKTAIADFDGLECRWNPVKTKKGNMLTLMVQTADFSDTQTYEDLLRELEDIYGTYHDYRPNVPQDMTLSPNPKSLYAEFGVRTHGMNAINRLLYGLKLAFETPLGMALFKWDLEAKGVEGKKYIDDLVANTDFQKFDDTLRMVIDSAPEQTVRLQSWLEKKHNDGRLYYGIHTGPEAIVTCLVFDRVENHLHFIDGASGGYALAAKVMKDQMKERASE